MINQFALILTLSNPTGTTQDVYIEYAMPYEQCIALQGAMVAPNRTECVAYYPPAKTVEPTNRAFALMMTTITPTGDELYMIDYNLSGVDCVEVLELEAVLLEPTGVILSCVLYHGD